MSRKPDASASGSGGGGGATPAPPTDMYDELGQFDSIPAPTYHDVTTNGGSQFGGRGSAAVDVFFNVSRVIVAKNVKYGIKVEPNLNMAWGTTTISNIKNSGIPGQKVSSITFRDPASPQSQFLRTNVTDDPSTDFNTIATNYNTALQKYQQFRDNKNIIVTQKTFQSPKKDYSENPASGTLGPETADGQADWKRLMKVVNDGANVDSPGDSQHEVLSAPNGIYQKARKAADVFESFGGNGFDLKVTTDGDSKKFMKRLPVHIRFNKKLPGESAFFNNNVTRSVLFQNSNFKLPLEDDPNEPQANAFRNELADYASKLVFSMLNALEKGGDDQKVEIEIELARNPAEQKSKETVKTAKALINNGEGTSDTITDEQVIEETNTDSGKAVRLMYPHKREAGFYRAEDMIRVVLVEFEPLAISDGSGNVELGNEFNEQTYKEAYMRSMVSKIRHYVAVTIYSDLSGAQHIKATYMDDIGELDNIRRKAYDELTMRSGFKGVDPYAYPTYGPLVHVLQLWSTRSVGRKTLFSNLEQKPARLRENWE